MIQHLVLFKFPENLADAEVRETLARLLPLQERLAGISHISIGKNFSTRSQGYNWALTVTCTDKDALRAYMEDEGHQAIVNDHIKPRCEAVLAVDYEF